MKLFLKFLFFIYLFVISYLGFAQIDNRSLENTILLHDSTENHILLNIQSNNFFKNNEYFGKISTGYTLMGSQFGAQIAYLPNPYVRIQVGAFLQKDFGNDTAFIVRPIGTLKLQKNGYSFLFGNIEGNVAHRLIEPLFNFERIISNPLESGLQFKIDRNKIWSDTWLNWEVMEYLGSNYQEQFSVGHHSNVHLYKNKTQRFDLSIQALVSHKGGQIDMDSTPLKTIANSAFGFIYCYQFQEGFLKQIQTENYITTYFDLSPYKTSTFNQGYGYFLNFATTTKYDITASLGYWKGTHFLSSRGGYLYQSEASKYGVWGYVEKERSLLFFRLLYSHKLFDAIQANVRFEPYYDFNQHIFEYSYAVYLGYKNDFSIFNFSKKK